MKLTCDLCGGELQMNAGGQGAKCTTCGLAYSMERLREMLSGKAEPPKPAPEEDVIYDVQDWSVVPPAPYPNRGFDYIPRQFVMDNNGGGKGDLSGWIRQGGIGIGDNIYIDGDYNHPYRIYSINDDSRTACAKEGMSAELFLTSCPRKVLKNARMVTGDPNPVANAYNYPGSVREYFSTLLLCEFSQYEIHGDVPRDELSIPVSYVLCHGGKPVLAVFLINSDDNKARYQVEKAARILAPEGVACTHFYENYRNDMSYVIQRVRDALSKAVNIGGASKVDDSRDEPVTYRQPQPIILEVLSTKKRLGMAWGQAKCLVRQGVVESGMPYCAHLNALEGNEIQVGSLSPRDITAGSEVTMLLYCDKQLLPTIKMLYVYPSEDYDDGDEEDEVDNY